MELSQYVHHCNYVPSSQAFILMVSNMHFYSCDEMKNDMGHAVPFAEVRNT